MRLFWRNKTPENSKQDVSKALLLHGGLAAGLEAVARWAGAHFGPTGAVAPAPSISGDYFCAAFLHRIWLFHCHYPHFAQGGMGRWVVCWRAGTARAVFVGRQCGPSNVSPAAAPRRCDTKTQNTSLVWAFMGQAGQKGFEREWLGPLKSLTESQLPKICAFSFQWKCKRSEGLSSPC